MEDCVAEQRMLASVASEPCEINFSPETVRAKQTGRFLKGQSGNAKGRPVGARNHATLLAERLMLEDVEAIVRSVVDAAKAGDIGATKIVLDRLAPVPRDRAVSVALPKLGTSADALASLSTIIEAVSSGEITPSEGETLSRLVKGYMELDLMRVFEDRIAALKSRTPGS